MSSENPVKKSSNIGKFLAAVIIIAVIVVVGVVAAYSLAPSTPTPSPSSSPTQSAAPTMTPSSTQTPSATQTPAQTVSPSATQSPSTTQSPITTPTSPAQTPAATPTPAPTPISTPTPAGSTVNLTIYGGSKPGGGFGFGYSAGAITVPGPTLTFKVGDTVNLTFILASAGTHNWAMVAAQSETANVVFGARVPNVTGSAGSTGSVSFTITQAGNYFYICQVPTHMAEGMWGNVVVNP